MKDQGLIGGLPFTGRKPRPLRVSKRVLTPQQAMSESAHSQQLFQWLRFWRNAVPEFAHTYHVANEHNGNAVQKVGRDGKSYWYSESASRRKAEGVRPGIFDLANHSISTPKWTTGSRRYSGLFLELKVRENNLTNEPEADWDQIHELTWLRSQEKSAHVVWSWAEAAALHGWYFNVWREDLWNSIGPLEPYLLPRLGGHDKRCGCHVELSKIGP